MNYHDYINLCNKKTLKMTDISHIDYSMLSLEVIQNKNPRQILWHIYNEIYEPLLCLGCNKNKTSWWREVKYHTKERGGYKNFCSTKCSSNHYSVREKYIDSCNEIYGTNNAFQNEQIKEKIRETNIEKYGVENPSHNEEIQEKKRRTNLEKYGVEYTLQNKEVKEKSKKTLLERYGVENPLKSEIIKKRRSKTHIERYGIFYNSQKHLPFETIEIISDESKFKEFINDKTIFEACNILKMCSSSIRRIIQKYDADDLYKKRGPTYLESEMCDFLNTIGIIYETNNRTILGGKELDFYIPEHNIAIEMNGLYYHSDANNPDKHYHYNKWKDCYDRGIHLVSIFEDDWNLQQEKVKNMLLTFFNKKQKGVMARKTKIQKIDSKVAKKFLDQYHLQGFVSGKHYGAFDSENLIGVMTFGYTRNQRFELSRFVMDNYSHPGLFSKLFHYAQKELLFNEVVSFSDNSCFTGNVYNQNGFKFIKILQPDYRYIFNKKRVHKSNFKKDNIKKKFPELYEEINNGMTEHDAMEYLGIPKVWDCGKCEWVWKNETL